MRIDQVWDYALDLKNFHETSHDKVIAPILIATEAREPGTIIAQTSHDDQVFVPMRANSETLGDVIRDVLSMSGDSDIDQAIWPLGRYEPTPTIVEAARALYHGQTVDEISRSDAKAINLGVTSDAISRDYCEFARKTGKEHLLCHRRSWFWENPGGTEYCDRTH